MPGYHPVVVPRTYYGVGDYNIEDSINKAEYLSNATMEDTYEAAVKSRSKDVSLLQSANAAIDSVYYRPYIIGSTASLYASRPPMYYPRYNLYDMGFYDPSYLLPRSHTLALPGSTSVPQASEEAPAAPAEPAPAPAPAPAAEAAEPESTPARSSGVTIPLYYYVGGDPNNMGVSELRRRIRRTICKTKGNPNYYRNMYAD